MEYTPRYWGTFKGNIIEAIAIEWCFSFQEVRDATNIDTQRLYDLIGELMREDLIYVYDDQYRVSKELYYEYWDYAVHFTDLPQRIHEEEMEIMGLSAVEQTQPKMITWINTWVELQNNYDVDITVNKDHFYLDGSLLPAFIHDLVRRARSSITYVSPWIEEIGVTKNLMTASSHGKRVLIVTREPEWSSRSDWGQRQAAIYEKCHSNLTKHDAVIFYRNEIHGKVLLVDDLVAVISSFNLLKNPASGLSWEAGIVTYEPDVINSIKESISRLITDT